LEPKALGLLACLRGPGSFTGVRLGFSVVKGISAANGAKTVSIPTLDCMASPFLEWPITCIPSIDSRRNQYYAAIYKNGEIATDYFDVEVGYIAKKLFPGEKLLLTGPDADKLKRELEKADWKGDVFIDPNFRSGQSRNLLKKVEKKIRMNEIWDENLGMPIYVRKSDAEEKNVGS
jgi:tRNA threonylcarbamoyladenosine biosynthesis protein TsaB